MLQCCERTLRKAVVTIGLFARKTYFQSLPQQELREYHFRICKGAAPLKFASSLSMNARSESFPHLQRCGPIEV